MGRIATVRVAWDPSVSKIVKNVADVNIDGVQQSSVEVSGADIVIEMRPFSVATVVVTSEDNEGLTVASTTYVVNMDDLEDPKPVTNFRHKIESIRDEPEEGEE